MTVVLAALLALRAGTQPTDRVATGVALLFAATLVLGSHLARAVELRTLLIHPAFAQLPELARQRRRLTRTRTRHALAVLSRGPAKQSATNATERTRVPQINGQNAFKRTDCRDRHEHVNDDPQRRRVDLDQLDAGPGNVSDAEPAGCRRRGLHRRSFLLSALIVIGCAGAARASAATAVV